MNIKDIKKENLDLLYSSDFWDNYNSLEEYKEAYLYDFPDDFESVEDITDDMVFDRFNEDSDIAYRDLMDNYTDIDVDQKVVITGELGLWNGIHEIRPVEDITLKEAIEKCGRDADDIAIYAAKDNSYFYIEAYHHDGTNCFGLVPEKK